jgi:hypothetical protein
MFLDVQVKRNYFQLSKEEVKTSRLFIILIYTAIGKKNKKKNNKG